jgi:hypothetical protein
MNLTRGALLAGGFRTHHQLVAMSADDQRNTLIVEMANHSNQANYQSFSDEDLAGVGVLMVFLLKTGIRTAAQLKKISADDQRNIMIVEIDALVHLGKTLQGLSNVDLVLLGLGQNLPGSFESSSFIRGMLLAGSIRTHHQLLAMSADDQRNTLIVEMANHSKQPVAHFQSLNDFDLAGAGAAMDFLLKGGIRSASQLKTMSDDDQRNTAIVEVGAQTHLGARLQGLRTIDVVATALGVDPTFGPAPVPAPPAGLGSNSNYILYSNCKPVLDLSVTIIVTQDIVCQSASGPITGFGFQLNAYSPQNERSAWQQYVVAVFETEILGAVDNWPLTGANLINDFFNLTSTPNNKIPAGNQIKISLHNDSCGNVTGATYVVIDSQGNTQANVTVNLTSISGVTAADLSPIVAFELNLVGPANSESAVLSSGAGTIMYAASSVLTVLNQEPPCAESGYITAETANSVYGALPGNPRNAFSQSFNVGNTEAPMIRKRGKHRPGMIIPPSFTIKRLGS